jgi:hypothetical protein
MDLILHMYQPTRCEAGNDIYRDIVEACVSVENRVSVENH